MIEINAYFFLYIFIISIYITKLLAYMIVHMIKNNAEEILCEHFILWNLYMYKQNNKYDILLLIVLIKTIHTQRKEKKLYLYIACVLSLIL